MSSVDASVNSFGVATVYVDSTCVIPEDSFDQDGWPTTITFVGPGAVWSGTVIDINAGDASDTSSPI
jgi:hypothetical protein